MSKKYPKTVAVLKELSEMDSGEQPCLASDAKEALKELSTTGRLKEFSDFVWYKGKVWFNPRNPVTHRGEVSLWSVKNDGLGVLAKPHEVHDCNKDEMNAIRYFADSRRNPDLARICLALDSQEQWWRNNQEDPHNIANAIIAAIRSVRNAIEIANKY